MQTEHEVITVVVAETNEKLTISTLCFNHDNKCRHHINKKTIEVFLQEVRKYGATIFPSVPATGCYAFESEIMYEDGETPVKEIFYKGSLIYSSEKASLSIDTSLFNL